MWPLLKKHRWPVSYFTGGQNVPDDIEPATTPSLARRILGLTVAPAALASEGGSHG
jgi:flagellar biosynthesis GTPase FlhF